jgi:type II secretory pathway component GspD/PulD (secretin)
VQNFHARRPRHLSPSRHHAASLFAVAGLVLALGSVTRAQDKAVPVLPPQPAGSGKVPSAKPQVGGRNSATAQPGFPQNRNNPAAGGRPNQPGGANPPGFNPGNAEAPAEEAVEVPNIDAGDGFIEFSNFAEAVELTTLVEIVAQTLEINIYSDPNLSGSIVFNAPVKIKKERLLDMLRAWLELHKYVLVYDRRTEFYAVVPAGSAEFELGESSMTTRVFVTEGIRPSSLKSMIDGLLGSGGASVVGGNRAPNRGQPQGGGVDENGMPIAQPQPGNAGGGGSGGGRIVYNDELGLIIMVDSQRRIDEVATVIERVIKEYALIQVTEIDLNFVSPTVAKQRILEMLGQAPQGNSRQGNRQFDDYGNPIQQQQPQAAAAKTNMDNLAERLTASPNGNSLFFRGKKEEVEYVKALIKIVDAQSRLEPKTYRVGSSAKAVADIARQRGMGEVTTIKSQDEVNRGMNFGYYYDDGSRRNAQNQQQALTGGAVLVVDEGRGQIIYYATPKLHAEMDRLIKEIEPENDAIVMREYRLVYAKSKEVAATVLGLINNQTPQGGENESGMLPSGGRNNQQPIIVTPPVYVSGNDLSISGKNSFIVADEPNNQVIVKAPLKEQAYYKELISRLDLPVPQVYIEAQIVAVTGSDTFRLAFENQLINANGTGGVVNTNFGLSDFPTGTGLPGRKNPKTSLKGITGAIIKSDQVPIVINALRTVVDTRVLSSPSLLVDANTEEAIVESKEEQPTATRNLATSDQGGDSISFGGYEEAGTKLTVKKPQIGPGDSVGMEIDVELSSFTGTGTETLPPPKNTNNISSKVQVPANMTIVIGGVVIDTNRDTVDKIPLLGDIPFLGFLFQDQSRIKSKTTLYVFITPRVQRDERFQDMILLTKPAMKTAGITPGMPEMKPVLVDFLEIREPGTAPAPKAAPDASLTPPPADSSPSPAAEPAAEQTKQ